jgi:transcriptional regulator with XRE-family HTH domain
VADDSFGLRLKELREAAGLSQPQLAQAVGLTTRQISRLETGVSQATWPTVQGLCAALSVDCTAFNVPATEREPQGRGRPAKPKAEAPPSGEKKKSGRPRKGGGK